jgi:hypothetical protein
MPIVFVEGYDQIRLGDAVALEQIDAREYPQSGFFGEGGRRRGRTRIYMHGAREGRKERRKMRAGGRGGGAVN